MNKTARMFGFVVFLIGLAVFLYPYLYRYKYQKTHEEIIEKFNIQGSDVKREEKKHFIELYEAFLKYNEDLYLSGQSAMSLAENYDTTDFSLSDYGHDDEILGYVEIPAIDVKLPIYNGSSDANMAKGATHLPYTSMPIGGINTNSVIASHLSFKDVPMFRYLINLNEGDDIYITNFWEKLHYKVVSTKIIFPHEYENILIQEGKDLVTLSTCYPYPSDYQRFLVYAQRVAE